MSPCPWTRLEGTPLWIAAEAAQSADPKRHYHNFDHVRRLYRHAAETFGLPYDSGLDQAILCHDVIVDAWGRNEERSAAWLLAMDPSATRAASMIHQTIAHRPGPDNRIVLLDLADFLDAEVSARNSDLLAREAFAIYGLDERSFQAKASGYLAGLNARITEGMVQAPATDHSWLGRICEGVGATAERLALLASAA